MRPEVSPSSRPRVAKLDSLREGSDRELPVDAHRARAREPSGVVVGKAPPSALSNHLHGDTLHRLVRRTSTRTDRVVSEVRNRPGVAGHILALPLADRDRLGPRLEVSLPTELGD